MNYFSHYLKHLWSYLFLANFILLTLNQDHKVVYLILVWRQSKIGWNQKHRLNSVNYLALHLMCMVMSLCSIEVIGHGMVLHLIGKNRLWYSFLTLHHKSQVSTINTIILWLNTFVFRNDVYQLDRNNPIKQNTILTLDGNGGIQNEWGSDLFFMPHHLTIDAQNNVWVTDVALHQVFKFPPYGGPGKTKTPVIRLGEKVIYTSTKTFYKKFMDVLYTPKGIIV